MEGGSRGGASWGGPAPRSAEKGRARGSTSRPDSYEPAYIHIVRVVSERIARGEYRPGDQLPSESQFCAEFGVSPMTLRRAVNMLVDRGVVATAQGRGTFVRGLYLGEASFTVQQLTDRWLDESTEVRLLAASIIPAAEDVAAVLSLSPGASTVFLRRLFLNEGHPFMYHSEHVVYDPRRPLVESQLQITSLDGVLKSVGSQGLARARLSIRAVNLEELVAGYLERLEGTAAFRLEHIFEDFDGSPVSWGSFYFLSDEFHLVTTLGAGG